MNMKAAPVWSGGLDRLGLAFVGCGGGTAVGSRLMGAVCVCVCMRARARALTTGGEEVVEVKASDPAVSDSLLVVDGYFYLEVPSAAVPKLLEMRRRYYGCSRSDSLCGLFAGMHDLFVAPKLIQRDEGHLNQRDKSIDMTLIS